MREASPPKEEVAAGATEGEGPGAGAGAEEGDCEGREAPTGVPTGAPGAAPAGATLEVPLGPLGLFETFEDEPDVELEGDPLAPEAPLEC